MAEADSVGKRDMGLREVVFLCETSGKLKRKCIPQKTSRTACLVTGLQLWRRLLSSWKSLLDNIENPGYIHKNSLLLVYIKGGTSIQHLKDGRQSF